MVLRIIPAMIAAKKITPKNSRTPSRQLRMVQPTVRAMARATREQPSTTKKAIVFLRLAICTVSNGDCTAKLRGRARWRALEGALLSLRLGKLGRSKQRPYLCQSGHRHGATEPTARREPGRGGFRV